MKHLISVVIFCIVSITVLGSCKKSTGLKPDDQVAISPVQLDTLSNEAYTKYGISESSIEALDLLKVGDKAPDFKAKDQNGSVVFLSKLVSEGPVVIIFYRGNWCSYCSQYLASFVDELQAVKDAGAKIVAIAPEGSAKQSSLADELGADITFIADPLNRIMYRYGVAFRVNESYNKRFSKSKGTTIAQNNDQEIAVLPVPATFVLEKGGKIKWSHFDPDYSKRPIVTEIISQL